MARPKRSGYKVAAPAFRIKGARRAIFLDDGRLALLGPRGISIWDIRERRTDVQVKTVSNAWAVAGSAMGGWLASKNGGEIAFSSLSDGSITGRIKRPPFQDSEHLVASKDGRLLFDASSDGDVFAHDPHSAKTLAQWSTGSDFMASGVNVCPTTSHVVATFAHRQKPRTRIVALEPSSLRELQLIEIDCRAKVVALSPDGQRIAIVEEAEKITSTARLLVFDRQGRLQASTQLPGRDPFFAPPAWSQDGATLAVVLDRRHIILLDAFYLRVIQRAQAPRLGAFTFSPQGDFAVAISDDGGVVLPRTELALWSEQEGQPAAQLAEDRFAAFERRIALRKASPPRIAVFQTDEGYRVEAEHLAGYFRYLPQPEPEMLPLASDTTSLGSAARRAFARFTVGEHARTPCMGPGFAGEHDQLRVMGVPEDRMDFVRYLGHAIPFRCDAPLRARLVTATLHEGRFDLWPSPLPDAAGRFVEDDWPHFALDDDGKPESLGSALLKTLLT